MVRIILGDEGTLDRVWECFCDRCGKGWTERYLNSGEGFPGIGQVRVDAEESHCFDSPECFPGEGG